MGKLLPFLRLEGEIMSIPSESAHRPQGTAVPNTESPVQQGQKIPKATQKIWNKLSADLVKNPELHCDKALEAVKSFSSELIGQDLSEECRADILANYSMLEKTLLGLKCGSAENQASYSTEIKQLMMKYHIDLLAIPEHLAPLQRHAAEQEAAIAADRAATPTA